MKTKKLFVGSNQKPVLLNQMDEPAFQRMAESLRSRRMAIIGELNELATRRPAVAAYCTALGDFTGMNDLDDAVAGAERQAIAAKDALTYCTEAIAIFERVEVSRCTLANIEVLRQEGAARLVAAEKIDAKMQELISAVFEFASLPNTEGVARHFGSAGGRLKGAWNFHLHRMRYRDQSRATQLSLQAMSEPLGVAQAKFCFAEMTGNLGDDPAVVEQAARNALAGAQSDLSALLNQMNPVANDAPVDPSTALLAA